MSSLKYWIWLSSHSGVGPVTALRLLNHFGSPENVFNAGESEYRNVEGVRSADFARLAVKNVDEASKILGACAETRCRALTFQDAEYPERLRNIYDPPLVLYVRGMLPPIDEAPVVSVVGTRDCTPYGIASAETIGYELSRNGFVVATGLARGVDSAAARGALRGGGRVIGVIGSGPDIVYPPENKSLFDDVASSGAIISEYPPGVPAVKTHFPARNRILSGIALGVAVIEAPKKSGALITASRALEQGRDVFTLPGNVDAKSCEGSNALLREGAIPILSADDIISEYAELFPDKKEIDNSTGVEYIDSDKFTAATENTDSDKTITAPEHVDYDKIISALAGDERTVAETICNGTMHIDDIIVKSGLSAQQVLTALTMLEIKGSATQSSGKHYSLASK